MKNLLKNWGAHFGYPDNTNGIYPAPSWRSKIEFREIEKESWTKKRPGFEAETNSKSDSRFTRLSLHTCYSLSPLSILTAVVKQWNKMLIWRFPPRHHDTLEVTCLSEVPEHNTQFPDPWTLHQGFLTQLQCSRMYEACLRWIFHQSTGIKFTLLFIQQII